MPKPMVVVTTAVATGAYLLLAISGWGEFASFFSHQALIVLTIVCIMLAGAAAFSGGNLSAGEREDRGNRWVIVAFGLIGLLLAFLPAYTDRKDFRTIDGDAVRWVGVVLFAIGGALRIWPVAIRKEHELVTSGVYGIIRHPSYLSLLVSSLGWALAFRSSIGVVLRAAKVVPLSRE